MSAVPPSLVEYLAPLPLRPRRGLELCRLLTDGSAHPLEAARYVRRDASLRDQQGAVVFEQTGVEVPAGWSQSATDLVASMYFAGRARGGEREWSVRQLIGRVVGTLVEWGREGRYFHDRESCELFEHELAHLLLHQLAAFSSPIWFNLGCQPQPQCSACFISSVEDNMASILELTRTEGMLFKHGSGTGSNLSRLRSSREPLAAGGAAAGPVAFMRGFEAFAEVIKSGGRVRPAAKVVVLDAAHPDIAEFVRSRAEEERQRQALERSGFAVAVPGRQAGTSHAVRLSDELMQAAVDDGWWETRAVTTGATAERLRARDLVRLIASSSWTCGDPWVQYETTINAWNPCPGWGRIAASNPFGEYLFLDDTACSLASLNLLRFLRADGSLDTRALRHAVDLMVLALEIMVDFAYYPTERIAARSRELRPLGLGYSNLGALLMRLGLPYDSPAGRALAAGITALISGQAFLQSARLAQTKGSFGAYPANREAMLAVLKRHRAAVEGLPRTGTPPDLAGEASAVWEEALEVGTHCGFRNAQVTALAPTTTVSRMLGCESFGVDPLPALTTADGRPCEVVTAALGALGYSPEQREAVLAHLAVTGSLAGAPGLDPEHAAVFDCVQPAGSPPRRVKAWGRIRMLAAVQPFLCGGVSSTIVLPTEAGPEELAELILVGWRLGLKSLRLARDGSRNQLAPGRAEEAGARGGTTARRRLADERPAFTHRFAVEGCEGYATVGLFEDGTPGELHISLGGDGSELVTVIDAFAAAVTTGLQQGVALEALATRQAALQAGLAGWTGSPQLSRAAAVVDHVLRWMASRFQPAEWSQARVVATQPGEDPQEPLLPFD